MTRSLFLSSYWRPCSLCSQAPGIRSCRQDIGSEVIASVNIRLPRISAKLAIRALERDGWHCVRTTGGHKHFKHDAKPGLVTVSAHSGETLYPALLKSILRQADLTVEEFSDLIL